MPETDPLEPADEPGSDASPTTLRILERTDTLAHIVVAIFFLLLAITVLIDTGVVFTKHLPMLFHSMTGTPEPSQHAINANPDNNLKTNPPGSAGEPETAKAGAPRSGEQESAEDVSSHRLTDVFVGGSLDILSSILFAVIILELLRTIITYLQTHDTQAIMKEFLVVGIISSVRKILLVGAESSMHHVTGKEFIDEAFGTIITIAGIILLIFGLVILRRAFSVRPLSVKAVLTGENGEHRA